MWLERKFKKIEFIQSLVDLDKQVILVRGCRQVGKTSFILNALEDLKEYNQIKVNFLHDHQTIIDGQVWYGRDFFGQSPQGEDFIKNIELKLGNLATLEKPVIVFVDEVDRYPKVLEAVQTLADCSRKIKCVMTGSNLENLPAQNAATGRKRYFDLYPITFFEFLQNTQESDLSKYLELIVKEPQAQTEMYHHRLITLVRDCIRLGGMPRVLTTFLENRGAKKLPQIISDLVISIEENIKTILGEKALLYEYHDVLKKLALLSLNTLKYKHLQVQSAGYAEVKRLLAKTVGARVAHKIRLFDQERDLSKYMIADCGIANCLLSGTSLLEQNLSPQALGVLSETFVGNEIVSALVSRDDLFYWKSPNKAEVEFLLRSPCLFGVDVKSGGHSTKSLNSLALIEAEVSCLVLVGDFQLSVNKNHRAFFPNDPRERIVPLIKVPFYLSHKLDELLKLNAF